MNYQKIYEHLCANGQKSRRLGEYTERHHIIPKCLNGSNDSSNLTVLTYREHFIAHLLLTKLYPKERGIRYAFLCMLRKHPSGKRILTSRMFDVIKKNFSKFKRLYCTIPNPGKSEKSRNAAKKRMTERNPISLDPSKNRTCQPIRIYFLNGSTKDYRYAKEFCNETGISYSTMKSWLKNDLKGISIKSKKHNILKLERIYGI